MWEILFFPWWLKEWSRKIDMNLSTVAVNGRMPVDSVNSSSVSKPLNGSYVDHAPQFTHAALIRVYVLVILGIISLVGNCAILLHINKTRNNRRNSRHSWSAIYTLILHLSIADLLVTVRFRVETMLIFAVVVSFNHIFVLFSCLFCSYVLQ